MRIKMKMGSGTQAIASMVLFACSEGAPVAVATPTHPATVATSEEANMPAANPPLSWAPDYGLLPRRARVEGGGFGEFVIQDLLFDVTETTVAAYYDCVDKGACHSRLLYDGKSGCRGIPDAPKFENFPIDCVSRTQASVYCNWVGGRLPTSAEWEWAARGGMESRRFPWGDEGPTCAHANVADLVPSDGFMCGAILEPVGLHPRGASRDGIQDLQGNVTEWTSDSIGVHAITKGMPANGTPTPDYLEPQEAFISLDEPESMTGFRCVWELRK